MGIQGIRISEKALNLFMKAAKKLQECGGETDDDDLWSFAIDSSPNVKDAVSDSALETVRRLEAVEGVLHDLLDSCKRKLSTVKAASRRHLSARGIQDLPDEVLSDIFESVVEDNDESGRPRGEMVLTHVCSRFRSLALSIPALWAYIKSTMSSNEVLARLELSKNCLLTIVIGKQNWCANIQQFLGLVIPHAHRWKSFDSDLPCYEPTGSLEESMNDLQLPQLEFLYVESDHFGFLRTWNTPKLRCVRMSTADSWPPRTKPRIPLAPGIFSSQALWSLNFDKITFSLEVVDYLRSAPNLTELRITTSGISHLDVSDAHGTLPRLREMTLRTDDETVLVALIGCLRMPELSILDLHIECRHVWDTEEVDYLETYPSVNELNVSYYYCEEEGTLKMDLSPIFVLFPEVKRLNLFNCNFVFPTDVKPPPLLSCSAAVCQEDEVFLMELVYGLQQHGRWEQFEFFQLKPGKAISWRRASGIVTEEKLRWYK